MTDLAHYMNRCTVSGSRECASSDDVQLGIMIDRRGRTQYADFCPGCRTRRSEFYAKKAIAELVDDPASLVIFQNHFDEGASWPHCARCGHSDHTIELHHWAPYSLFEDPNDWPMSYLCRACHREWHQTTGCALAGGDR